MRAALGASRGRLARALLSESVLLALAGGAVGLVLAEAALGVLRIVAPAELPRVGEIDIDVTVLFFTILISVLSGAIFGIIAVLKFWTPQAATLKESGRSSSDGPARHRTRHILAVSEVALALTLLVVSGLMIRTFVAMRQIDPGFTQPKTVQTFRIAIPRRLITDTEQAARAHQSIAERLAQVPGVTSVGLASSITMDGEDNANPLFVEDAAGTEGTLPPLRRHKSVGPGFFETMGNRVIAGRPITWTDVYERRPVVVVSSTLAREYWPEPSSALGRRVRGGGSDEWHQIVGVVGDERDEGVDKQAPTIALWPMQMTKFGGSDDVLVQRSMTLVVRSSRTGSQSFAEEVSRAVWSVNPNLPVARMRTLEEIVSRSLARTSFTLVMLAIAGAMALLLGVAGIYGVIAYAVSQRTREIGIRMALGAQRYEVTRMFVRDGLGLTAIGIVAGLGAAFVLMRLLRSLLFEVSPADPLTYVAVCAALTAAAMFASYVPARRATSVNPVRALRAE